MDFSDKYIKMCKEATEIQVIWCDKDDPEDGDFYICEYGNIKECKDCNLSFNDDWEFPSYHYCYQCGKKLEYKGLESKICCYPANGSFGWGDNVYWLPKLDQLFDLAECNKKPHFHLEGRDGVWVSGHGSAPHCATPEQSLIQLYMFSKHGLFWNENNKIWSKHRD